MATLHIDKNRQVVPRWRRFLASVMRGENSPLVIHQPLEVSADEIRDVLQDWKETPGVATAGDLVSVCIALGLEKYADDAVDYLATQSNVPNVTAEMAKAIKAGKTAWLLTSEHLSRSSVNSQIALEKARLRYFPQDPFRWADLSWLYVTVGQNNKAASAMQVALSLAPANRMILRAASRLWLHLGDNDRAHHLLKSSPLVKTDPWILSAEIAIASAAGEESRLISAAKRLLEQKSLGPYHLSELASAVGTLQIASGNMKQGKKQIKRSLEAPSENALAQAAWLGRGGHVTGVEMQQTGSHEANAWLGWRVEDWTRVSQSALQWQQEQPFSARPASLGSFAAGVNQDFHTAVKIARQGLLANPHEFMLKNNAAFSLARMNEVDEASKVLAGVNISDLSPEETIVYRATQGMIAFRKGDADNGRRLYMEAVFAAKLNDRKKAAVGALYRAGEEVRLRSHLADEAIKEAMSLANEFPDDPHVKQVRRVIEAMISSDPAPSKSGGSSEAKPTFAASPLGRRRSGGFRS